MIAKIIPLLRLGKQCDFFDYGIPETLCSEIAIGHLVQISFRKKKVQGIVWRIGGTSDVRDNLKPIELLIKKNPIVTRPQIALIEWFASFYRVSLPHAASIFIPQQPKKTARRSAESVAHIPTLTLRSYKNAETSNEKMIRVVPDWNECVSILKTFCEQAIKENNQLLILTPSVHDARILSAFLAVYFPQDSTCATGATSKSTLANAYNLLAEEMCHIAISTRMALGWNIPKLTHIIMVDFESRDYKQYDKNPRFDTRTVCEYILQKNALRFTVITFSPSCEMIEQAKIDGIPLIYGGDSSIHPLQCINLVSSFRNGNHTFISDELQAEMKIALGARKNVFLYLNRKGYGSLARCSHCSYVFICGACGLPQRYSKHQNSLRCTTCHKKQMLPNACPECFSHDISFPGIGTEKIAHQAATAFPKIPIHETSADSPLPLDAVRTTGGSIIIGTSHFFQSNWELCEGFGCIGIIAADPIASLSDFRSCEYQWQMLMRINAIAQTFTIPLIIQAFEPSSIPVHTLVSGDWKRFNEWQNEQRKRFSWPPYSRIIKIIARHHTALIPNAMQSLTHTLREALAPLKDSATLFRTRTMQFENRPYILVRINGHTRSTDPLPRELEAIMPTLLNDWLIDIDPVTF